MTKKELLEKAGYVPKLGRPKLFTEVPYRYVIQVPQSWKDPLFSIGAARIRQHILRLLKYSSKDIHE